MVDRYTSEILAVVTPITYQSGAPSVLRLGLFGGMYADTLNTGGPEQHYLGRIKSDVIFTKKIGVRFWGEKSGIDFGYLDIAFEDQDDELLDFARYVSIADIELYRINLNTPGDPQMELLASARTSDIAFADENTIRLRMESMLKNGFDAPINELFYGDDYPQLAGKPYPIAWAFISDPQQLMPAIIADGTTLEYHVTDLEISSFESVVYDRGVVLVEGASFIPTTYGFILNQNPDGGLKAGRILIIDPYDTSYFLLGLFRFVRLAINRAGLWDNVNEDELSQLEDDIGMGDIFPQYFTMKVQTLNDFLEEIFGGVTGWYYVDENAEIHFGRLTDPDVESAPPFDFTDSNMIGKIKVEDDRAKNLSSRIAYAFSPGCYDDDDLAGSIVGEDRADKSNCFRIIDGRGGLPSTLLWTADAVDWTVDSIIYTADGFAGEGPADTPLNPYYAERADAAEPIGLSLSYCFESGVCNSYETGIAELYRWWGTLYHVRRRFYTFDVKLNDPSFNAALPQLGDFCTIQSNRFGLIYEAKNLFIRQLKFNFAKNLLTVEGWG